LWTVPKTQRAPLPVVEWGRGWGSLASAFEIPLASPPSPPLPHKGGGSRPCASLVIVPSCHGDAE
jgi:hypothetical protein